MGQQGFRDKEGQQEHFRIDGVAGQSKDKTGTCGFRHAENGQQEKIGSAETNRVKLGQIGSAKTNRVSSGK